MIEFESAIDAYLDANEAMAVAERHLRNAKSQRQRAQRAMIAACPPEVDNARPGFRLPDYIERRRQARRAATAPSQRNDQP